MSREEAELVLRVLAGLQSAPAAEPEAEPAAPGRGEPPPPLPAPVPVAALPASALHALVESVPDALVVADADGRIVLVNGQTERLFGYARDELLGRAVELLVPERLRARHVEQRTADAANP